MSGPLPRKEGGCGSMVARAQEPTSTMPETRNPSSHAPSPTIALGRCCFWCTTVGRKVGPRAKQSGVAIERERQASRLHQRACSQGMGSGTQRERLTPTGMRQYADVEPSAKDNSWRIQGAMRAQQTSEMQQSAAHIRCEASLKSQRR